MGASRSKKGSGKGHMAEGLELVHSESKKQVATGISRASLLKPAALPQGRVLAQGALFCLVRLHSPQKAALLFKPPYEESHCCSREKEAWIIFSCQLMVLSKGNPGSSESRAWDPGQAAPP